MFWVPRQKWFSGPQADTTCLVTPGFLCQRALDTSLHMRTLLFAFSFPGTKYLQALTVLPVKESGACFQVWRGHGRGRRPQSPKLSRQHGPQRTRTGGHCAFVVCLGDVSVFCMALPREGSTECRMCQDALNWRPGCRVCAHAPVHIYLVLLTRRYLRCGRWLSGHLF